MAPKQQAKNAQRESAGSKREYDGDPPVFGKFQGDFAFVEHDAERGGIRVFQKSRNYKTKQEWHSTVLYGLNEALQLRNRLNREIEKLANAEKKALEKTISSSMTEDDAPTAEELAESERVAEEGH